MPTPRLTALAAIALFALVGCSGTAAPATGAVTSTTPATPAASTAAASDGSAASASPSAAPSPSAPASAGSTLTGADLCKLFTAAVLTSETGAAYGEGVPDDYGQCTWRVGGAKVNDGKGQLIAAIQDASLDTIKGTFAGGDELTVGGKAAYWNPASGLQSLWVDLGGRTFVLSLDPVDDTSKVIMAKLGAIAVGKL